MAPTRRQVLLGAGGALVLVAGGGAAAVDYEVGRHPSLRARIFGCGSTPPIPRSGYRIHQGRMRSAAMNATLPYTVALPAAAAKALLIVFPGRGDDQDSFHAKLGYDGWATAARLPLAFASPGGTAAHYYHPRADGTDCLRWVTEEFLPQVRSRYRLPAGRMHTGVIGWSMGGYGALLLAQQRPDLVSAAVASSPAVFPTYHDAITGHPDTFDSLADWEQYGVWLKAPSMNRVAVRVDCGNADPFMSVTKQLMHRIPGATGHIDDGCHDDGFWRRNATAELEFLAARLS